MTVRAEREETANLQATMQASTMHVPYTRLPKGRLSESAAREWEDELRGRLGLLPLDTQIHPRERRLGWIVTALAALLAAFTRLFHLGHPKELIFDETYYVKGAYSLLHHGFEGSWAENTDDAFASGDFSGLNTAEAAYVVHPPLGKWILALGQGIFGSDSAFGWRFASALLGVIAVCLVVRIALRLFRSPVLAGVAGCAMALDGMGIVMSRAGLLDNVLAFFILVGFWAVLRDREYSRARLAHAVAYDYMTREGGTRDVWGPRVLYRPWLIVAGLSFGAAMGVKWSGIYAVAVFGVLVFLWGVMARKAVGAPLFWGGGVFREGLPAFIQLVPVAVIAYLLSWLSWFINPHSWGRTWAQSADPAELPLPGAPNAVNSFLHYHSMMWDFHHGLDTPHDYQSQAWAWIVQARPVSFYWKGTEDMSSACPNSECVQAISSIGNIAVWWLGVLALVALIGLGIHRSDWRAGAIGAGYVALWLPWFVYANRTTFQFYAIVFLPFVVLAVAWAIGAVTNTLGAPHSLVKTSPSVLFAGKTGVWRTGVVRGTQVDEDDCFPDFAARDDDGEADVDAESGREATAEQADAETEKPLGTEGEEVQAVEGDTNIYARLVSRVLRAVGASSDNSETTQENWWQARPNAQCIGLSVAVCALIVVVAIFWYPLWIGSTISYDYWHLHMWFESWI